MKFWHVGLLPLPAAVDCVSIAFSGIPPPASAQPAFLCVLQCCNWYCSTSMLSFLSYCPVSQFNLIYKCRYILCNSTVTTNKCCLVCVVLLYCVTQADKKAKKGEFTLGKIKGTSKCTSLLCVEELSCRFSNHEGHAREAVQEASAVLPDCIRRRSSLQGKASWRAKKSSHEHLHFVSLLAQFNSSIDSSEQERRAQQPN